MQRLLAATACFLITACGGSRPSIEDFLPPPDTQPAEVKAVLERCAVPDLQQLFTLLDVFDRLLDPDGEDPQLLFTGLRILDGCIDWQLDNDQDGVFEITGSFCFRDSGGAVSFPFNPTRLGVGVEEVADLLADLPDGTNLLVSFQQAGAGIGALTVRFDGGQAQAASGTAEYSHDECSTTYGFTDVLAANLLAPLPNALISINMDVEDEPIVGTLSLNGTPNGVLSVTHQDRLLTYTVDLESFAIRSFDEPF